MTDVKCSRCGALTISAAQICKVCEIELNPISRPSAASVFLPSSAQPFVHSTTPDTSDPKIRPFHGVGDVLEPTLILFTKNFWLITKLCVVIVAPFEILKALSIPDIHFEWQLATGLFVLDLLCPVLIAPALTYSLLQVMQTGVAPSVNEAYRWGFSKLGKLMVCAAISWLLVMLGYVLCFIPGVVVGLSLSLVFPIAILENGSPSEILHRSYDLTQGHRWKILGASIVVVILMLLFGVPVRLLGEYLGSQQFAYWPFHAAGNIFSDIMNQSLMVLSLVTYLSIRALWSKGTQ